MDNENIISWEDYKKHDQCEHDPIILKRTRSNGVVYYEIICSMCGKDIRILKKKSLSLSQINNAIPADLSFKTGIRKIYKSKNSHKGLFFRWYSKYLQTTYWKRLRNNVLKSNNNRCFYCNKYAKIGHHLTYINVGNEKPGEVIPVCKRCHDKIHSYYVFRRNGDVESIIGEEKNILDI